MLNELEMHMDQLGIPAPATQTECVKVAEKLLREGVLQKCMVFHVENQLDVSHNQNYAHHHNAGPTIQKLGPGT